MSDALRTSPSGTPLAPAATVACLRDAGGEVQVLLLRRDSRLAFHGGAWVFPGGRVDPVDLPDPDTASPYQEPAARRAAVRETLEEAALRIDGQGLVPLSHWTTPPGRPRRFATWFFLGQLVEDPTVRVDMGEITAHRWLSPAAALRGQARGELTLPPPTFVTLTWLARFSSAEAALREARVHAPERFVPRPVPSPQGTLSLYEQDAGYASRDPEAPGPRHRLEMGPGAWVYKRDPDLPRRPVSPSDP